MNNYVVKASQNYKKYKFALRRFLNHAPDDWERG